MLSVQSVKTDIPRLVCRSAHEIGICLLLNWWGPRPPTSVKAFEKLVSHDQSTTMVLFAYMLDTDDIL